MNFRIALKYRSTASFPSAPRNLEVYYDTRGLKEGAFSRALISASCQALCGAKAIYSCQCAANKNAIKGWIMCYTVIVSGGGGDGSAYKGNKERSREGELTQLRKIIPARGSILASCFRAGQHSTRNRPRVSVPPPAV